MWQLYLGVLLFAGPHLFSTLFPAARDRLKGQWGEGPYKGLYSLVSVAGVVFLVLGYGADGALEPLYEPWHAGRHLAMLLILIGFILIFSNGSKGHIRKAVKHPFSLGIVLWAVSHLLVNGEMAVVVIFAMLLVLALADIVFSLARGKMPVFEPDWKQDLRGIAVGVVLYLVFAFGFHPYILGVPVA